ncbi:MULTISPECIES: hypothetical protein [Sphingobacterium]|uniref:hypothetical protein n=1 Tax=Sphingobacterium TaxID=28453 RepID=UPI00257FAC33|nr:MULTISPECIES: hypothetical protein [Sphingobacterium]
MALSKTQQKEYAKTLFVKEDLHQKIIAERVGVTEKTIGKWISDGGWKKIKTSMLITKDNQIANLYDQLEKMNEEIKNRPTVYDIPLSLLKPAKVKDAEGNEQLHYHEYNPKDFPVKFSNYPTSAEADIISKLTSSIGKLETETGVGHTIEVAKKLIALIQQDDFALAKKVTGWFDVLIQSQVK